MQARIPLGTLAATLVNNGTVNFATGYGGCCGEIVFTMTNGTIENNGQFIFHPTGGEVSVIKPERWYI
ncbi:MAG: hypothetical protein U0T56_05870 [Ferruginibacter sp.]